MVEVTNPAVNGFTTLDLIRNELGLIRRVRPQLVTLLIGVNDLVQGRKSEQYRDSLVRIHDAISVLKLGPGRMVAISIPDWSVVPAAADFGDRAHLRRLTETFNAIAESEASRRGFDWVDITPVSLSGEGRPGWIADDRLHPGDIQYAAWAEVIWDKVQASWKAAAL